MPLSAAEAKQLRDDARRFNLDLSDRHLADLGAYIDLLLLWRSHARLISRRQTRADLLRKHIADCFALVPVVRGRSRIADLGAGAGLPGIPLAIVMRNAKVALVEPNRRKANFLREVVRQLDLGAVEVVEHRAEDWRPSALFDAVVSRALWTVPELLARANPLLEESGLVVAMKGPAFEAETAAARLRESGFRVREVIQYRLAGGENRALVALERFT
jgi:16S rRNA (guanine527-N7)-methyltransferase